MTCRGEKRRSLNMRTHLTCSTYENACKKVPLGSDGWEAMNENGNQNTAIKRKRERDKICRLGMNEQKKWEEERTRSNLKHDIKSNKSEAKDLIMSHDCLKQQQQMWRCDSCDKLIGFCFSFIRYCCFCCLWTSMKYCGLIHMHDSIGFFWNVVMTSQHILPNFALFHSFTHRSN